MTDVKFRPRKTIFPPATSRRKSDWDKSGGGAFASINRPTAGPTHDKALPVASTRSSSIRWARRMRQGHDHAGGIARGRSRRRRV